MRSQQRKQVQGLSGPRDDSKEEPASLFLLVHPPSVSLLVGCCVPRAGGAQTRKPGSPSWVPPLMAGKSQGPERGQDRLGLGGHSPVPGGEEGLGCG